MSKRVRGWAWQQQGAATHRRAPRDLGSGPVGPSLRGRDAGQNRSSRLGEGVSVMGHDSLGLYPEREEKPRRHQNRGETCRTHILTDS